MYFDAETRASIVRRFHFALSYPGYLFLGKAEMLLNHSDRFQPVDLRERLFRKASPTTLMESGPSASWIGAAGRERVGDRLESAALTSEPAVQLAVDLADKLRVANSAAETLFNLRPRDLGRPFQDLEVSYRPVSSGPVSTRSGRNCVRSSCTTWNGCGRAAASRGTTTSRSSRCSGRRET